jgi:anti-anti-sigma factor
MNSKTYSVHSKKDNKKKNQTLVFKGDLSLGNAPAIHSQLLSMEFKFDLVVELREIESLDLSSVQILYSLQKSVRNKGLKVNFTMDVSERIRIILNSTGFSELFRNNQI